MKPPENSPTGWNPDKEPKEKIQAPCWACNHTVRSSLENTLNEVYTKQPWFSHVQLRCLDEQCGAVTLLFHDQITPGSVKVALQYPTSIYEFCENEDVVEVRGRCVGAHEPETIELSKRAEDMITRWGEFLQHITVDETDFYGD